MKNDSEEIRLMSNRAEKIVEDLSVFPDDQELFSYLIERGRTYPVLPGEYRTEDYLLPGCISQLWIRGELRSGGIFFHMDADAAIPKGLAALLLRFYEGHSPAAVAAFEPSFLERTAVLRLLSGNRRNSLSHLRGYIRTFAMREMAAAAG